MADSHNHVIKVFDSESQFLYKFGGRGNEDGQFEYPDGLIVDGRGNLLVCDRGNNPAYTDVHNERTVRGEDNL